MNPKQLLQHELDALRTTAAGEERIRKNCRLDAETDPLQWCREQIANPGSKMTCKGKNSYITTDTVEITVNRSSLTVITAHPLGKNREKKQNTPLKEKERETVLFLAVSLDGYLADKEGKVDWLNRFAGGEQAYEEFITSVDTVLMGWNTYEQIVTELSPNEWVYPSCISYVLTHRRMDCCEQIRFTDQSPTKLIDRLKGEPGKDIWVCGGANLAAQLIKENRIDRYEISVLPVLIGKGIPLFYSFDREIALKQIGVKKYGEIVQLSYRTKGNN